MHKRSRFLSSWLLAAAMTAAVAGTACGHHHYRVYDPYYSDYHVWNDDEVVYYRTWSRENHRDNTAIFASYLQRSRKNTGPGGTVTATIARLKFEILQGRAGVDALALGFLGSFSAPTAY